MSKPWPPPGRIGCEVIGCWRTAPASKYEEGTIIICGKCSRQAPAERKEFRKWRRLVIKANERGLDVPRIRAKASAAWDRLLAVAIEVKVGIRATAGQKRTRKAKRPPPGS